MSDLKEDGVTPVEENKGEPVPPTSIKTTRKDTPPPVSKTTEGFAYTRGNFDTAVVTLLATINMNIVRQTELLEKAIKESKK